MGKPEPVTPFGDAVSLHSQPGESSRSTPGPAPHPDFGGDDDLPPMYDELPEEDGAGTSASAPLLPGYSSPVLPSGDAAAGVAGLEPFRRDDGLAYYLDRRLDGDPELLEAQVRRWASLPPRPFVRVRGTHKERRRGTNGKDENRDIADFDVQVELTPYLYADAVARKAWDELRTADDADKVHRGTVLRHRAPGAGAGRGRDGRGNIELGMVDKPSLAQWCHMYCASHSGLKTFALRRKVLGFDAGRVREQIETMVRRTNYRGRLEVTFPVRDEAVEVWSECMTNRWRLTRWIYVLFCIFMLWTLSWPYLFFRTKRFEVVTAEWHFSRADGEGRKEYVSLSEDQWYNLWGRALAKAVLSKRQGTLDQQDLIAADVADPTFNSGSAAVDGALGVLRAGVSAMNEVNRHLGWGEDRC